MGTRRSRRVHGFLPRFAGAGARVARWLITHPGLLLALTLIGGSAAGLWMLTTRSEAFRVATIDLPLNSTLEVPPSVRGQPLWTVDVRTLAQTLKAQAPDAQHVRVLRVPPDTVRVELTTRQPIGQVQLGQWHAVDARGYVFPEKQPQPFERLVMLKGIARSDAPLKIGRENDAERLQLALRLAAQWARSPILRAGHRLTAIDVTDPRHITFVLNGETEVRCGAEEELAAQLDRLQLVLRSLARQDVAVDYIDVRFDEPVVHPRES